MPQTSSSTQAAAVDARPRTSGAHPARVRGAATVFSDLASVSGARVASAALSVLTVMVTTRILTPAGYALIAYVTVVASLMFTATSAWTAASVTRYGREELEQRDRMAATSWMRLLITAPLLAAAAIVVVALKLGNALPAEMTWPFVALALLSGTLMVTSEHLVNLLEASGRMKLTAVGLTLRQALALAALAAILVTGYGRSPSTVIALNATVLTATLLLFAARLWRVALWPPAIDRVIVRRLLAFSVPMIAFSASQYFIRSVDIVVLRAYASQASVGVYAVAYQGYSVLQQIATTATIVLTPLFVSLAASGRHAVLERYLRRAVPQLVFLAAALAGIAVPLLGVAVPIVFGQPFHGAARPLAVLFGALVLYAAASFLAPILMLGERSRAIAVVNLLAAAINGVGDVVFVGPLHMGTLGPALATTLALAAIAIGYMVSAHGYMGIGGRSVALRDARAAISVAPVAAAIVPVLLLHGPAAVAGGLVGALLAAGAILRWASPFGAGDADMIEKLDMPIALKRMTVRMVRAAGP